MKTGEMFCKKNIPYLIFIIILIMQMIMMTYFAHIKEGYHVDELWSYGLANSYYFPHIFMEDNLDLNWVDGDFFKSYITVDEGERFTYDSVKFNMEHDSHPPMYFMILHTISSFFPSIFSKWFGLMPNILCYGISALMLYILSNKVFNNKYLALLPCVFWGFSKGAVSVVIYIRMYCMVTMWALCFANLHYKMIFTKRQTFKNLVLVTAFTFCGFMTHYFFIIFAFFGAAYYSLFLMFQKRWKDFGKYCCAMAVNFIFVLSLYPRAFRYLFTEGYGSSMVQQMSYFENWISNIKSFANILDQQLFGYLGWKFLILLIFIMAAYLSISFRRTENIIKVRFKLLGKSIFLTQQSILCNGFLVCSVVGYFIIVSKISPYLVDRYIFLIYPFIALIMVLFAVYAIKQCKFFQYGFAGVIIAMMFMTVKSYALGVEYLYVGQKEYPQIAKEYEGTDCLFITFDYYELVRDSLELENFGKIHAIAPSNIELVSQFVKEIGCPDKMIIYFAPAYNNEETLKQVLELSGYTNYEMLFSNICTAYIFS